MLGFLLLCGFALAWLAFLFAFSFACVGLLVLGASFWSLARVSFCLLAVGLVFLVVSGLASIDLLSGECSQGTHAGHAVKVDTCTQGS